MSMDFQKELNQRQYEACSSPAHRLRIIAGAGTGKTRVLTYRIAYLITHFGVYPQRIVAITFTNKVAKEMTERVAKIMESEGMEKRFRPLICTFHGYCYRFLKREMDQIPGMNNQFSVLDDDDAKGVWKTVFDEVGIPDDKDSRRYVVSQVSGLKSRGIFYESASASMLPPFGPVRPETVLKAYGAYQRILKENNTLDFDDLLMFTLKILTEKPEVRSAWQQKFDAYLVDEFQDTNELQYRLIQLLLSPNGSLTVVGDPDQTIYTWRGADNDIISKQLPHDYKDLVTVTLDLNYRSTQKILDRANMLIKNNSDRLDKSLTANNKDEGQDVVYTPCYSQENEAAVAVNNILALRRAKAKYADIAIIYRSNYLSSAFEKALTQNRIPYAVYGGQKFLDRKEVKDALAYLRLLVNPKDDFSFLRVIKAPSLGIGDKTLAMLKSYAESQGLGLWEAVHFHLEDLPLRAGIKLRLRQDITAYETCQGQIGTTTDGVAMTSLLNAYLTSVGFIGFVQEQDTREEKDAIDVNDKDTRLKNVQELLSQIRDFLNSDDLFDESGNPIQGSLEDFLIDVALQADQDTMEAADKVMLMTVHVSKGLEFPYVFVVGLNDDVFPSSHAFERGNKGIEEERRLFYVAITRAKKGLYLSSFNGYSFSSGSPFVPSMFLKEIGFNIKPTGNPFATDWYGKGNAHMVGKVTHGFIPPAQRQQPANPSYLSHKADELLNIRHSYPNKKPVGVSLFSIGDKIAHISFGVGEIVAVSPTSITVKFKEPYGTKTLAKSFTKAFKKVTE